MQAMDSKDELMPKFLREMLIEYFLEDELDHKYDEMEQYYRGLKDIELLTLLNNDEDPEEGYEDVNDTLLGIRHMVLQMFPPERVESLQYCSLLVLILNLRDYIREQNQPLI